MKNPAGVLAVAAMSGLLLTAVVHAQSPLPPQLQTDGQRTGGGGMTQLQTDGQRMGGGEMTQLQTDGQRSASRAAAQAGAGSYGGQGIDGEDQYGGYGNGMSRKRGVGATLGASAAVDAVNAAAGLTNRSILRGSGNPLYLDDDGRVRNDRPDADGGTNTPGSGRP